MTKRPIDDGETPDADRSNPSGSDDIELEETEFDAEEAEMAAARRKFEMEQRQAWGKWRQDREQNRRKVLRSLVGLVIAVVLTGLLAYGCDSIRGPRSVKLASEVSGYVLQPPNADTLRESGQFDSAGATGSAAGIYRGPSDVLFVSGYARGLPIDVVEQQLPPVLAGDIEYPGNGGPLTCGPTADGSRCAWSSGDLVGGTTARGLPPEQLEKVTRDLRAGAIR